MKRLTITLNDEMENKVRETADNIGIPQSSVINIAIKEYFDKKDKLEDSKYINVHNDLDKSID